MKRITLALAFVSAALSGCVVVPAHRYGGEVTYATPGVVIDTPPPAPYAEVVPAMPYAGAVWIGGYWGWTGGRHHWVPGYWERPHPGYRWEPHRWENHGGHWQLRMGGWVRG